MTAPLVSVVIPTYERPDFLPGAIETASEQSYGNLELVVVDDGSGSEYATEIAADCELRVRVVEHEENRGLSAARNTGIDAADGEYIAFLDDDDRWHETKIERQVARIDGRADVGLVSCCVASVTPAGEWLRSEDSKPSGEILDALLRKNVVGSPSRVLVSRACVDDVGTFDESLPTKQDWDLYIRIARDWRIETIQEVLCYRTVHPSMSSDPAATERDLLRIRERYESLIRERGLWASSMAYFHLKISVTALFQNERETARAHITDALGYERAPLYVAIYCCTFLPHPVFAALIAVKRAVERTFRSPNGEIDAVTGAHR